MQSTTQENDMTHLDALELRLSNERIRLAQSKTDQERKLRAVWIKQIEKEITAERKYDDVELLSIDELAAELAK
jgi:hypothetical protein